MMDDGFQYSLCMVYPGKQEKPLFYRVADFNFEDNCFESAVYTKWEDADFVDFFLPTIIGFNPEKANHFPLYQTVVLKWKPHEVDKKKQWSYQDKNFKGSVFEIVHPKEIDYTNTIIDDQKLREILYNGVTINEQINEQFLMVVGKEKNKYVSLQCKKSDFQLKNDKYCIEKSISDILHSVHYVEKFYIPGSDIVSTEVLTKNAYIEGLENERYFYRNTSFKKPSEKFYLRTPDRYVNAYFIKYFKNRKESLQLTTKDINQIRDAMNQACENEQEIENFFDITGFSKDIAAQAVKDHFKEVVNIFTSSYQFDDMVNKCLLNDARIYEENLRIVKDRWLQEQDELKNKKNHELENLNKKEMKYLENLKIIEDSIIKKNILLEELNNEIEQAEKKKNYEETRFTEICEQIEHKLHQFKTDIVETSKLIGISEAINEIKKVDCCSELFIQQGIVYQNELLEDDYIEDLQEFCGEVSDNLRNLGFKESVELAATTIAAFLNRKSVILSDSMGLNVANSISALLNASSVETIYVPSNYSNIRNLVDTVNNTRTKVVFIDGLLNSFNESAFVAINKFCTEKYLCFGVGTLDTFFALSKNIWNYSIYLETESFMNFSKNDNINVGKFDIEKYNRPAEDELLKIASSNTKPYLKAGIITKKQYYEVTMILETYFQMIRSNKMGIGLSLTLYFYCLNDNKDRTTIIEKFENCGMNEEYIAAMSDLR